MTMKVMPWHLDKFIAESNQIEGIEWFDAPAQEELYRDFLLLDKLTVKDITDFALALHTTCTSDFKTMPILRIRKGLDVLVGNHRPIPGGPEVEEQLKTLLKEISSQKNGSRAYEFHCKYETLHPLMDCNGRTGRAIWAWLMFKSGYCLERGFLHQWYYQSLDQCRV